MKPLIHQLGVLAFVAAACLLGRVAWADAPVESPGRTAWTDDQLQEALDRAEGRRFRHVDDAEQFQLELQRLNRGALEHVPPAELDDILEIRQSINRESGAAAAEPASTLQPELDGESPTRPRQLFPPAQSQVRPAVTSPGSPQYFFAPRAGGDHVDLAPGASPAQTTRPHLLPTQFQDPAAAPGARTEHARRHESVAVLRDTAQRLDMAANELERRELYEQADAARELAQRLRLDARELAGRSHEQGDSHPVPFGFTEPPAPHFEHPWSQPDDRSRPAPATDEPRPVRHPPDGDHPSAEADVSNEGGGARR